MAEYNLVYLTAITDEKSVCFPITFLSLLVLSALFLLFSHLRLLTPLQ